MKGDNNNTIVDVVKQRGAKTPATVRLGKAANSDNDGTESGTCQAEQMDGERARSAERMCEKVLWLFAYIPGEVAPEGG